jgi:hypothetical protein
MNFMSSKSKQTKVRKQKAPPEPTLKDEQKLEQRCWHLPGWQFDSVIKPHCIHISLHHIGCDDSGKEPESAWADLFGLIGVYKDSQERICSSLFLRHEMRVYQLNSINDLPTMLAAIRKQFNWFVWQEKQEQAIAAEVKQESLT